MQIAPEQVQECRRTLEAAGLNGEDLDTSMAATIELASPYDYRSWRKHITTLTPQHITAEYGHYCGRAVAVLAAQTA